MELSEKITYLRKKRGWSQEQLASRLEVSRQAVYKWEAGISQPEIEKLKKIGKLFAISYNELLDDDIDITASESAEKRSETVKDEKEQENKALAKDEETSKYLVQEENNLAKNALNGLNDNINQEDSCNSNDEKTGSVLASAKEEKATPKLKRSGIIILAAFACAVALALGVLLFFIINRWVIDSDIDDGDEKTSQSTSDSTKKPNGDSVDNGTHVEKDTCRVTFDTDGGTAVEDLYVKRGNAVGLQVVTEKEGHIFLGWVNTKTYEEWDIKTDKVMGDIGLCAVWMPRGNITVTFHKNDGSEEVYKITKDKEFDLTLEELFTSEDLVFKGWGLIKNGTVYYGASSTIHVDESIDLYALWEKADDVFTFLRGESSCTLLSYTGTNETVRIPAYYDGLRVTGIADYAFGEGSYVKKVIIPDGVIEIGEKTFFGCDTLEELSISGTVSAISTKAFNTCVALKNITVSLSNPRYSSIDGVLYNKEGTRLTKYPVGRQNMIYNIPNGTHYIEDFAFYECFNLTEIYFPDGVGGIGASAFEGCRLLKTAELGNRVDYVGGKAFYHCKSLEKIIFEHNLYSIGKEAFYGCTSLKTVEIQGDVGEISYRTFAECPSLYYVCVGGALDKLDEKAFESSGSFTEIVFK